MPDYQKFIVRHGESVVQDLVERLERYEGVRSAATVALEERWERVMAEQKQAKAA